MTLTRHARRHPVTGPVAMEETHISFGGEVTFFLFVVGPLGPPPSLARFASLESPGKCPFSTKQNGLLCGVGIRVWRAGPDRNRDVRVAPGSDL